MMPRLTRRRTLAGLTAAWVSAHGAAAFAAAGTDRRFVVILLRGAMDGLSAVPPYGDRMLAELRGPLVPPPPGTPGGMFDLGGFFGLDPALPGLAALYRTGELLIVHAVAGATRSRSHFDAQDSLECGTPERMGSGWLNRVVAALPPATGPAGEAMAVGVGLPLLLRGPAPAESWLPDGGGGAPAELLDRVSALAAADPVLGPAIAEGLRAHAFAGGVLHPAPAGAGAGGAAPPLARPEPPRPEPPRPEPLRGSAGLALQAGRLLAAADGPRIAALEIGGWDTHAAQAARLRGPLGELDATIMALRAGLGEAWAKTVVLAATEFGRTVRMNGTQGTDHGTAGVAFLAGGAVAGGRVLATWPGLGPGRLLDDRDLAPTTDLRSVVAGVVLGQLALTRGDTEDVFPDWSADPLCNIIRV